MKPKYLLSLSLALLIGIGLGFTISRYQAQNGAQAQELKMAVQTLKKLPASESLQLREYLKGRIYSLLAQGVRPEWVSGESLDFGPLDRAYLGSIKVTKGPESDEELYRLARKSAGSSSTP